jgi:hypothetical protein
METLFRHPNGEFIKNPSEAMLRKIIFNTDEKYWNFGAGEISLETQLESNQVMLTISFKAPYGFLVQYGAFDSTDDYVAISSKDYTQTIEIFIGGNPWTVPTSFFISQDKAWKAVLDFLTSGKMTSSLNWVMLAEQEWNNSK